MIDFVKIQIESLDHARLRDNELLEFIGVYLESTGEPGRISVAKYYNMEFMIHDNGSIIIQGSLHKLKNDGYHNYDDFTLLELTKVIGLLREKFGIEPKDAVLRNLEIGVNITPPIPTDKVLENMFLFKTVKFKDVHIQDGDYRQAALERYYVKAYDKGLQYELNQPLFRWELKFRRMIELNIMGIHSLADLVNPEVMVLLGNKLVKAWDDVLFADPTVRKAEFTYREKENYMRWNNPNYWIGIKEEPKSKNQFSREKRRFQKLMALHSDNVHQQIRDRITKKWGELTGFTETEVGKINTSYIALHIPTLNINNPRVGNISLVKGDSVVTISGGDKEDKNLLPMLCKGESVSPYSRGIEQKEEKALNKSSTHDVEGIGKENNHLLEIDVPDEIDITEELDHSVEEYIPDSLDESPLVHPEDNIDDHDHDQEIEEEVENNGPVEKGYLIKGHIKVSKKRIQASRESGELISFLESLKEQEGHIGLVNFHEIHGFITREEANAAHLLAYEIKDLVTWNALGPVVL